MARVEVMTPVERRRRWTAEEKQLLVAESAKPGRTVSQVARAHGIMPAQLFTWRRQMLAAAIGTSGDGFVPVQIEQAPPFTSLSPPLTVPSAEERIDIWLPNGIALSVGADVTVDALRRVVAALSGG
jgi:transposase